MSTSTDFNARFDAREIEWDGDEIRVTVTSITTRTLDLTRTRAILAAGVEECVEALR
jgi:hypothetical protein